MSSVTTSLLISFTPESESESAVLVAEVDSREDGLNNGDTTFRPGDPIYYLTYAGPGVSIVQQIATAGGIASVGGGNRQVTETVTWANVRDASVSYPVAGGLSIAWCGRNPGKAALSGSKTLRLPDAGVGVAKVTYTTAYHAWRLSGVPTSIEDVLILIEGTT